MPEAGIVYLLFFLSAALASIGLYNYFTRDRKAQGEIKRRIHSLGPIAGGAAKAEENVRRERLFSRLEGAGFRALDEFVLQTGLRLEWSKLLFAIIIVLCGVLLIGLLSGFLPAAIAIAICLVVTYLWLNYLRNKRIARFEEQLPDAIDVIVRSIRAGHPLPTALSLVSREIQDPAAMEFGVAYDELAFGLELRFALRNLDRRVGAADLRFLVTAVTIQSQSGGNLADILTRLAAVMRERSKLRQKIKAMTAEGRISAVALTLLPLIVLGVVLLVNPNYYGDVWGTPAFRKVIYLAGGMLAVGNLIMRRMVNFKF